MNLGDEILTGLIAKTMYTVDIVTSLKNYVLKLYHNFNNQMNITEINLSICLYSGPTYYCTGHSVHVLSMAIVLRHHLDNFQLKPSP